jgi:hypothetical protein
VAGAVVARKARGRYQLRSPSSFMVAGRSTARTIVASIRIATREADAQLLHGLVVAGGEHREGDHHDRGGAGDDAGGALFPWATAALVDMPRSTASRIRLRTNTW